MADVLPARRSSRAGKGINKRRSDDVYVRAPDLPFPNAKDASAYSLPFLLTAKSRNPTWFDRLDFVNVSDEIIRRLFVNDYIRERHSVLFPPPRALRRRASQLREFYRFGVGQQRELIEKYSAIRVGARCLEEYTPPTPKQCNGIRVADIRSLRRLTKEQLAVLEAGFEDVVSEAMQTRGDLLAADKNRWVKKLRRPIGGLILSGNGNTVRWAMEEDDPTEEDNDERGVFDLVSFRDDFCTRGDAVAGKSQCMACLLSRKAFFRRCRSTYDMNKKPVHPFANDRFLRTISLQRDKIVAQRVRLRLNQKNRMYYK